MKKSVLVAQFVPDRRYKDGRRLNGHVKQDIRIKVPCNPSERKSLIKAGILYILLSLFYWSLYSYGALSLNNRT